MQSRSIRRSDNPLGPLHSRMRVSDRDLIRGEHYSQRSCEPHSKAEHMAAPTRLRREDSPCQLGAVHTWPLTSFTALQKYGRYRIFVVDQIVGVVSKKWISVLPCNPSRLRIGQRDLFWRLASVAATARTAVLAAVLLIVVGGIENSEVLANRARRLLGLRPRNGLIARHSFLLDCVSPDQARIDRKALATD